MIKDVNFQKRKDKRKVCSFIGQLCSTDKVSLAWKKNWVNSVARLLAQYINILADYKMRKGKTKTLYFPLFLQLPMAIEEPDEVWCGSLQVTSVCPWRNLIYWQFFKRIILSRFLRYFLSAFLVWLLIPSTKPSRAHPPADANTYLRLKKYFTFLSLSLSAIHPLPENVKVDFE